MESSDPKKTKEGVTEQSEIIRRIAGGLEELGRLIERLRRELEPILTHETLIRPSRTTSPGGRVGERLVYGVFDGEQMVGEDRATYPIPANYASKSKLVTGDKMKLLIEPGGSYVYKQIQPVEREQVIGSIEYTNGQYWVRVGEQRYRILLASISFYHLAEGDRLAILLPRGLASRWATVEHKL